MPIIYGNFLFRYRNILFPFILVALLLGFKPVPFAGSIHADYWLDFFGLLLVILGQAVRASVIGLSYIKRGGVNKKIYADTLVTDGIFAHCRNPLYLGNLLILSGFFVIHNNIWVYIIGGGFFLISYNAIVEAEEFFLCRKFGEVFNQYCTLVHRWLFHLRGIKQTFRSMEFNWYRVIVKDYTTMLTWVLTVVFILAEEHISLDHALPGNLFMTELSIIIMLAFSLALWVRILKKSGKLSRK